MCCNGWGLVADGLRSIDQPPAFSACPKIEAWLEDRLENRKGKIVLCVGSCVKCVKLGFF